METLKFLGKAIRRIRDKSSVVSAVRDFILIVLKVKQCSECSQRFPLNSSEVKRCSKCS